MKWVVLLAAVAALTGCQGTPIGDAMIGKEKLAEMDSAYCQSIGATKGSDTYMQCRMFKDAERQRNHQAAFQRAGAGLSAAGRSMQQNAAMNRPVNCTSQPSSSWVGGPVSSVRTTCY